MGDGNKTFSLPLNTKYGVRSLVSPEASGADDKRYWAAITSVTGAPTAATDGVPCKEAEDLVITYQHDGDGAANGSAQLYIYHEQVGFWTEWGSAIVLTNGGASPDRITHHVGDILGANRVYLRLTALPNAATYASAWLLARNAKPTV